MSSLAPQGQDLDALDEAIKQLRIAYERYFAGAERLEPLKEREQVKKELRRLIAEASKNTARRFRLQSLQASVITYEQHWNRICRQIEEGTFLRDKRRAERILAQPLPEATPATADTPPPTDIPPPSSNEPSPQDPLRDLHDDYVRARQSLGDNQPVPFDSFAASLRKQIETLKAKLGCQEVVFKVAVKDGKAILKASPR